MGKNNNNNKLIDGGLLILRIGIGVMFIFHGWPKVCAGAQMWESLGKAVSSLGINFGFVFWGFMAAYSEFFGGIFLILGEFFRPFCALMMITMAVAATMHLKAGDGLQTAAHSIELGIVFFSLIFIGAGEFRLSGVFKKMQKKAPKKSG